MTLPDLYQDHLEILPAAFLSNRKAWQNTVRSLPSGACLIVINPKNQQQVKLMLNLAWLFRSKGKKVVIWPSQLP
jgi:hypothetical protein